MAVQHARRQHQRYTVDLGVRSPSLPDYHGKVLDLSEGGLQIEFALSLQHYGPVEGERIRMTLSARKGNSRRVARVRWVRRSGEQIRMGLAYHESG